VREIRTLRAMWRALETGPSIRFTRQRSTLRASSKGWHVQWESIPPGQESEPCNLGRIRGGNETDEADRQSHLQDGE